MKNIRLIRLHGMIVWIMIQMVVILTIIGALNLQQKNGHPKKLWGEAVR